MPYSHEKKLIPREYDRRVKITDLQKENIKTLFTFEMLAQREIARRTGVSRRMISFILFPERERINKEQFKERRKDGRYKPKKEEWRDTMKDHRRYKQELSIMGKLESKK